MCNLCSGSTNDVIHMYSLNPRGNKAFGIRITGFSHQKFEASPVCMQATYSLQTLILAFPLLIYIWRKYVYSTTE